VFIERGTPRSPRYKRIKAGYKKNNHLTVKNPVTAGFFNDLRATPQVVIYSGKGKDRGKNQ
jgi:hypothetical protein